MDAPESHRSEHGITTIPKRLRDQLNAPLGGRLVWALLPDGTLQARLPYADVLRHDANSSGDERRPHTDDDSSASEAAGGLAHS